MGVRIQLGLFVVLMGCGRTGFDVPVDEAVEEPFRGCEGVEADFFAQDVLAYEPTEGGGAAPEREDVANPQRALGAPDYAPERVPLGTVSIGEGGRLDLGFGDCAALTDGTAEPDLVLYEYGVPDHVELWVWPENADGFVSLGLVTEAGPLDLDGRWPDADALAFEAVRIVDVAGQGLQSTETPGADIDAIELVDVRPR